MDVREAMKKQTDVAMILSGQVLSSAPKDSNVIFSPASINSAITMHATGPGGDSAAVEILSFLRSSSIDELKNIFHELSSFVYADSSASGGPKIKSMNGLWIDKSLRVDPKYKDLFENFFKALYVPVDFRSKAEEVRKEVNSWVEHHTNNLIKDLLRPDSVTSLTDMIYANALYFKGAWKRPFEKYDTRDYDFHLVNGISVSVPFMTSYEDQYVRAYDGFKVLRLPYRQGSGGTGTKCNFSMYFYLPDKKDGLDDLLEKMTSTPGFLDSHIPSYRDELDKFRIPKFKIEFGFSVTNVLNRLGMYSMLMYHKACVEIDEEGAVAAAATDVLVGCALGMEPPKKIDFVADHPFLFLIREDNTGTVLFVGQLFDPSESCS